MNKKVRRILSLIILAVFMTCLAVACKKKEEAPEEVHQSLEVELEEGEESVILDSE